MHKIDDEDEVVEEPEGGADRPELNLELANTVLEIAGKLSQDLFDIDLALVKCKEALAVLQPMKSGRIDVKFWRRRTLPGTHPCVIKWRRLRGGLQPAQKGLKQRRLVPGAHPEKRMWTADRLKVQRLSMQANRSKGFRETHPWVVEVLDLVQELTETRAAVMSQLAGLRWYEKRWGQTKRERVKAIARTVELKMSGYRAVAAKLKDLDAQEREEARQLVERANEAERLRTWVVRKKDD